MVLLFCGTTEIEDEMTYVPASVSRPYKARPTPKSGVRLDRKR